MKRFTVQVQNGQAQTRGKTRVENWNNHKFWTVSIQDIEYANFYHCPCPKPPKGAKKVFRLKPERVGATIDVPLSSHNKGIKIKLGKLKMTQFPVNCNIATMKHKLQGVSMYTLIVNSWGYGWDNWVYVVLSRVRTRLGLFLSKKLDLKKKFKVPEKGECKRKRNSTSNSFTPSVATTRSIN